MIEPISDFDKNQPDIPERKMWAAVLVRAFDDLDSKFHSNNIYRYREHVKDKAIAWMGSNRRTIGSVIWICEILDLDLEKVRWCFKEKMGR